MSRERRTRDGRSAVVRQALGNGALRRVLTGYLLFNIGEWATWIAFLVWGYDVGGVRGSSAIAFVQLVPAALLAAPAATLLSRLPGGRALSLGYAAQASAQLLVAAALWLDAPAVIVGATAVPAALTITLTRPVHNALLPEISQTTADLTAGNAASGSLEAIATFIGPLSCGVLLAIRGPDGVFLTMSICSAIGAFLTARLVTAAHPIVTALPNQEGHVEGAIHRVLRNPAARLMTLLIAAEYALVGMMDILLVVLALDQLDMSEAGPGILNSAIGVGGIAGAGLTFTLIGRSRLAGPLALGALGAGLGFALTGHASNAPIAIALIAVSGAGIRYFDVAARTFVQRLLPDHLLTAMFGLQESFTMGGLAVGTVVAPLLVGLFGVRDGFLVAGCLLPLVALSSYGVLRRLDGASTVPLDVLELLRTVPTLAVLAPRIVERMARDAISEVVPARACVIRQGDGGQRFYVIASGQVSVDIDGREIRRLGPGEWFGEIALLRDVPRTASVTALDDEVTLWCVDRESFLTSVLGVPRSVEVAETYIRDRYA